LLALDNFHHLISYFTGNKTALVPDPFRYGGTVPVGADPDVRPLFVFGAPDKGEKIKAVAPLTVHRDGLPSDRANTVDCFLPVKAFLYVRLDGSELGTVPTAQTSFFLLGRLPWNRLLVLGNGTGKLDHFFSLLISKYFWMARSMA